MDRLTIKQFSISYAEQVKDLLTELQAHIAGLDEKRVIVLKENFREDYFAFILKELENCEGAIFLALKNEVPVGVIICKIIQGGGEDDITTTRPKIGFITDLSVTETQRGRGVGKALITAAERFFADSGCEHVRLDVFAPNVKALDFYNKLGYGPWSTVMSKKIERR